MSHPIDSHQQEHGSITVALPNYNHGHYLKDSLSAILAQSRPADRIVVTDDASNDNSIDIIRAYQVEHPSVQLVTNPSNRGVFENNNCMLSACETDYIIFIAADDLPTPNLLRDATALLDAHPSAALCSSPSFTMDAQGRLNGTLSKPIPANDDAYLDADQCRRLLTTIGSWTNGNTCVYRVDALKDISGFPASMGGYADGFISQVLAAKHGACYATEPGSIFRVGATSFSQSSFNDPRIVSQMKQAVEAFIEKYPRFELETLKLCFIEEIAQHASRRRLSLAQQALTALQDDAGNRLAALYYRIAKHALAAGFIGLSALGWQRAGARPSPYTQHAGRYLSAWKEQRLLDSFLKRHRIAFGDPAQELLDAIQDAQSATNTKHGR